MVKRKLSRKELKEDEVLSFVQQVLNWLQSHQKPLIYGACAVLGLVLVVWGVTAWKTSRQGHAGKLFARALGQDAVDRELLEKVATKYGRTSAGQSAALLLAVQNLENGTGGIDELERLWKKIDEDGLKVVAFQNVVYFMMNQGKYDDALQFLERAGDDIQEDVVLYLKGRIAEDQGQMAEAKAIYDDLAERYEESPFTSSARIRSQYL